MESMQKKKVISVKERTQLKKFRETLGWVKLNLLMTLDTEEKWMKELQAESSEDSLPVGRYSELLELINKYENVKYT